MGQRTATGQAMAEGKTNGPVKAEPPRYRRIGVERLFGQFSYHSR